MVPHWLQMVIGYSMVFGGLGYALTYLYMEGRTQARTHQVIVRKAKAVATGRFYAMQHCPKCRYFDVHRFEAVQKDKNKWEPTGQQQLVLTGEVMRTCTKCKHEWREA